MTIVELKTKKVRRDPRALPLDQATGAGRFLNKMVRDIEVDLGGRRQLSRIQGELIRAFAGAATHVQYLNHQIALGEGSEIDLAGYSQLASTMLRLGSKLGLSRRAKTVTTLGELIQQDQAAERARLAREREQQTEASS
ncbi:MAG: hypothetical protein WBG18_27540 [Xanthobacteraceae bacterium]